MEKGGDGGDKVPRIVQVMYFKDLPRPAMPPNSSQPPGMAMPQQWETQWQEFLKTLQPPPLGWGNPQATTESVPWEDAKAFLSSFEEVAEACQWPRDQWVGRLLPALRGGVKQCLWRLNARDKRDYGKVKAAILRDDAIRTESKRQHFRQCDFQEGPRTVYGQLQELCRQWLKPDRRSKEQILELIIQEQLLAMLPQEVQHKVKECGPEDCIATVALAESFLMSCQTAKTWEKQAPLPEGTVGSLETEGVLPNMARRQFGVDISRKGDGEIGLMANEATSTQSSDVVLPPEGQEMAGAGLAEEPVDVKNVALDKAGWTDQDLDQKPPLPWSVMQQISGNASASDGLSIPTPDISQPGPQETACTQRPENGADIPDSLLGGRLPSEIKTENSQESDAETEYSTLEPFPEDYQDNVSGSPEPSTQRELRPRKPQEQQQQGRATRGRKKRGNGIRKNKYYPKEKKHECPVCGHRAYFLSDLLRHMRCHSGKRPFRCLECGTTFSKKESFHTHQRRFHKSTAGGSSSSKKKMFDRSQEEVAASHQGTNKYVCPTCGFKATALKHLTEHMTIHTGERLYECPECGKMFRWMSNLSRHRRLHLLRNNLERRRPAGAEGSGKLQNHSVRHYRLRLENVLGTSSGIVADVCEPSVTSRLRPRKPLGQGASLYNEEAMALQEGLEWEDFFGPASLSSESVESRPTSRFRSKPPEKGQGDSRRLGRAAVAVKRSINYGRQKKHACQQCDYKSKRLSDVVKHMRVHTRERPYKCLECGISYRWLSNYTEHKKICTTSKRTPVPEAPVAECDVTLSDDEELINILQKSSQQRGAGSKTSPKIVSRTPKTNGVGTTSKRRVQRQSNAATVKNKGKERKQERKHECSVCGHRAVYWSDLIRHLRIHTREKPYQCQQCGKAFAQKSSLTGHKKIHTSDGAPSSRENHVKKNTSSLGEKNYTCSKCGHRASKLVALLKHMRVHLGERPYQCQDCGETFAWHSLLSRHQRTHMLGRAPNDTKAPVAGPQETSVGNEEPSKMLEENSPQERTELKEARTPSPEGAHGDVSLRVADGSSKEEKATPLKKQTESNEGTENSTAGNELVKRLNLEMFAYSKGEKSCQSQSGLVTDQIIHEKEKPQESSVCEKSHSIKCSLMKYQHGKPDVLPDEEADVKPYVCHDCGKCFSLEERLSRHQLMHTGLRPYSCAECGNAYNRRDALLSHLKSHGLSTTRDAPSTATASVEGSAKEEISVKLERTDEWEAYKQGSVGVGTEAAKTPADTYKKE